MTEREKFTIKISTNIVNFLTFLILVFIFDAPVSYLPFAFPLFILVDIALHFW